MAKYYGYIRVSTTEKSAKQDYERQRYLLQKSGFDFCEVFEEHVSGGVKGNQRKAFNDMLEKLQPEDWVCFTETSRFGRNYIDCFEMLDLITQEHKANVKFLSNGIELKGNGQMNPYEWLTISNFFIMDEFLKRQIGYNTKNALQAKKQQGIKLGRSFKYSDDVVSKIKNHREEGLSMQEISNLMAIPKSTVIQLAKRGV